MNKKAKRVNKKHKKSVERVKAKAKEAIAASKHHGARAKKA
jgi:hypothetical protein